MSLGITSLAAAIALASISFPAFALDGYLFVAPGGLTGGGFTDGTLHVGGGMEKLFREHVGVGAELGAVGAWNNYRNAIGLFSLNGSWHFADRAGRFDPFVRGGYTSWVPVRNPQLWQLRRRSEYLAAEIFWFASRISRPPSYFVESSESPLLGREVWCCISLRVSPRSYAWVRITITHRLRSCVLFRQKRAPEL